MFSKYLIVSFLFSKILFHATLSQMFGVNFEYSLDFTQFLRKSRFDNFISALFRKCVLTESQTPLNVILIVKQLFKRPKCRTIL